MQNTCIENDSPKTKRYHYIINCDHGLLLLKYTTVILCCNALAESIWFQMILGNQIGLWSWMDLGLNHGFNSL